MIQAVALGEQAQMLNEKLNCVDRVSSRPPQPAQSA
jgi:hypothetical protein